MSSPTKRFDVCAGRPYTTRDGGEKKQWINCGRGALWDDGGISIKLHAVPIGNWFDGNLNLFEQKPREGEQSQRQESKPVPRNSGAPQSRDSGGALDPDDDIPFAPRNTRRTWWM